MNFSGGHSIGQLASFVRLFTSSVPRRQLISGLVAVLGASMTEGISISLLGPLLGLIGDTGSAGPTRDSTGRLLHAFSMQLSLPIILAVFIAAVLCRAAFSRKRDTMLFDLQLGFVTALRRRLYCAIEEANWPFIAEERLSHLVKALTADVDSVAAGTFLFLQIPATVAVAAVQIAIAIAISPLLTLAVIACGGTVAILLRWYRGSAYQAGTRTMHTRRATFDEISDFLASLKLAKSHNAEERHRVAFEAAVNIPRQSRGL